MKKVVAIVKVALLFAITAAFYSEQLKDNFINSKRPLVTKIMGLSRRSGGTGFYVEAPSGKIYTLTNGHVCGLNTDGKVISDDGTQVSTLEIIEVYADNDLCLLTAPDYVTSGLAIAGSVKDGEDIYVLGHPLLEPKTLTKGQISGSLLIDVFQGYDVPCEGKTYTKRPIDAGDFMARFGGASYMCIRTTMSDIVTANILPGNSGSPVLDAYGHVVGVAFAGAEGTHRGFIVPLEDVKAFLRGR